MTKVPHPALRKYDDPPLTETFPQGRLFRVSFDSSVNMMKLRCVRQDDLDEIISAYSDTNPAAFFMRQYGYDIPQKISAVTQFGHFPPGLLFGILRHIKLQYGNLGVVAMSKECRAYVDDYLTPLKNALKDVSPDIEIENIDTKRGMRDYQETAIRNLLFRGWGRGMIDEPTSCHGKDHPILMYDGSIKKVQDVKVGDLLMGPDSKPRKVLKRRRGYDEMYRLKTLDKHEMVVNRNHVLSLVNIRTGGIDNIRVKDYLESSPAFRHDHKMYHVGVDFPERKGDVLEVPPYILGILLGDGTVTSSIGLTTADSEIADEFGRYARSMGCYVGTHLSGGRYGCPTYYCYRRMEKGMLSKGCNPLINSLKEIGVFGHRAHDKFIPEKYLLSSRHNRMELLAGLMDTDGCVGRTGGDFDFVSKSKKLAEDVAFLGRSLGFRCRFRKRVSWSQTGYVGDYYRVRMSGNTASVPLRCTRKRERTRSVYAKNTLRTGFSLEPIGRGRFYGFELSGDHLYLDGNFFVHHNSGKSLILCNFIHNVRRLVDKDYRFLILVPNKQLVFQMYNDFLEYGVGESDMTKFTAGLKKGERYNPDARIIVANRQYVFTNQKLLPKKVDALICDEVHQCCKGKTQSFVENFECGVKVGCSGSIPRGGYNLWVLNGMFGDVVAKEEITSLQKRGYVSKLRIYQLNVVDTVVEADRNYLFHLNPLRRYSPDENGYSEIAFNAAHEAEHEYYEKHYKDLYKPVMEYISKFDENILVLFDRIEFGKRLYDMAAEVFTGRTLHYIDGSVPVADRLEIVKRFESSGDNVLFAESATFQTGINVKRLTNLVFVSSSKSFPKILQSIGRTLRLHHSKSEARLFDVNFNFKYSHRHLLERLKIYRDSYGKTPDEVVNIRV